MKKIVLASSCVFLMNGFALADDNRYKVIRLNDHRYVIVDIKEGRIKQCKADSCFEWKSWGE